MKLFPTFLALLPIVCQAAEQDSLLAFTLQDIVIDSDARQDMLLRELPLSASVIDGERIGRVHATSIKNIVSMVPNVYMPDYGSRLTSAIYIRGTGSRINTPAVGLYVDNIPYVDKSSFDIGLFDIERIDVLRGPQGTLYGRNTMGGLIRIFTRSPFSRQGTDIGISLSMPDAMRRMSVSHYHRQSDRLAFMAGAHYEHGDGFFTNSFTGEKADDISAAGGRVRFMLRPSDRLSFDMHVSYDYSDEGGYPYFYSGTVEGTEQYPELQGKITANRQSGYRRGLLNMGLSAAYLAERWELDAITGYQYLNDRMFMDQDFISTDIYSMEQLQKISTLTEEVIIRGRTEGRWHWLTGISAMLQALNTDAPVTFHSDGLRWLESNINSIMPSVSGIPVLQAMGFTGMGVNFRGDELVMNGHYATPTVGIAMFHQSVFDITDRLSVTLGLRLDHEWQYIDYDSPTTVLYGFRMSNPSNPRMELDLQDLVSRISFTGDLDCCHTGILPKLAIKYELGSTGSVYASASMGQRSGGFNIQMFSDLIQGAMRADMMDGIREGAGIMAAGMPAFEVPSVEQIVYRPEYSINYEIGSHLNHGIVMTDASVFMSHIHDRQIARFASSGLGRMMVNTGESLNWGAELSATCLTASGLQLTGCYGYTHATFLKYDDGSGNDSSGNFVPFVPKHTFYADAAYSWTLKGTTVICGADIGGSGPVYWTENNVPKETLHVQTGARLVFEKGRYTVTFWGKNLTGSTFDTIWFESMKRGFSQHCKPRHFGIDFKFSL